MNAVGIQWVHALVMVIFLCYSDPNFYNIDEKLFFAIDQNMEILTIPLGWEGPV